VLPLPLLAKYPFLPGAAEFVGTHGPGMHDLLFDRAYARVRGRGVGRVRAALEDSVIEPLPAGGEPEALVELLSYGVGRMVVASLKVPYAARRSAMAEAKLAHERLVKEPPEVIADVAKLLGVRLQGQAVHFTDYLRHSTPIKEAGWKLVNQPLRGGYVEVEPRRLARLLQEAVRLRIEAAAQHEPGPEVQRAFAEDIAALRKLAEEQVAKFQGGDLGPVQLQLLPPCMSKLLAQLQSGVNVPHTGRFALTSFLHTVGMGSEEIMRLFAAAPDFKEEMTRYQVEHITGKTSGTEYTPPGCPTMVTNGVCPMEELRREERDPFCIHPRMHHPLTYYRWKVNDAKQGKPSPAPRAPAPPDAR
jgi:DNA primase large subunit